ncbi:MAG TPA: hypothetical protein VMT03_22135 [Polyangia bacterium]|nr:hypothetical protein [Polyangia bacterium]
MEPIKVGQLRVSVELGMCVITQVSKDGWVNAVWLTGMLATEGDGSDEGPSDSFTGRLWRVVASAAA